MKIMKAPAASSGVLDAVASLCHRCRCAPHNDAMSSGPMPQPAAIDPLDSLTSRPAARDTQARSGRPPTSGNGALTSTTPARAGWSLRLRINLIVATLMGLFVAALFWLHVDDTRRSVHEEISGGNRVAAQLLQRVSWIYTQGGATGLKDFLTQLGRVRANDITLADDQGRQLYRSPPSPYKAGRSAPAWFSELVAPPLQRQEIAFDGGRLVVEADPSRAILDGWDDLWKLAAVSASVLLVLNLGVFWLVGRTLAPLGRIEEALARIQTGDWRSRLPALPGREAASMGAAVNRMADALQGQLDDQKRAWTAERSLLESRELAWQIEQHMEAERHEIARELHDELGQSVTAIRTLAASLVQRLPADPTLAPAEQAQRAQNRELAALIGAEASRLDDAVHSLIPRLAPLSLDAAGLVDALADLVDGARQREPQREISLTLDAPADRQRAGVGATRRQDGDADLPDPGHDLGREVASPYPQAYLPEGLSSELTLTAYRVAQEGLNNALRHSGASRIEISLGHQGDRLFVQVLDNGQGLAGDPLASSRYGLRGLRERVRALGGEMTLGDASQLAAAPNDAPVGPGTDEFTRGCRLRVTLPLGASAQPAAVGVGIAPVKAADQGEAQS
jgi:two-component system sensor histidine kinase UhpB